VESGKIIGGTTRRRMRNSGKRGGRS